MQIVLAGVLQGCVWNLQDTWPPGAISLIHIDQADGERPPRLVALFASGPIGAPGLALCAVEVEFPCFTPFPQTEEMLAVAPAAVRLDELGTIAPADTVEVAGFTLHHESVFDFHYYTRVLEPDESVPLGWVGASWDGALTTSFHSDMLVEVPSPLTLLDPAPNTLVVLPETGSLPIRWVSHNGQGEVTLHVHTSSAHVAFNLIDDGRFDIPLDDIPGDRTRDVTVRLVHWRAELYRVNAYITEAMVTSEASFTARWEP